MKAQKILKSKKKETNKISLSNIFQTADTDDLEFEEMFINSDLMKVVRQLMKDNNEMTRDELASNLGVSKAYISKLFSSDKYFNVNLLAKLQRVFNTSFKVVTADMIKELKDQAMNNGQGDQSTDNEIKVIRLKPHNIGSESLIKETLNYEVANY